MEPQEVQGFQEGVKALKALVAVVATLSELVATVTAPRRRLWPLLYPESLHAALRKFTWTLRDTLDHGDVTSLCQGGVTPLGRALAALKATPRATWADVRAVARAWLESEDKLEESWYWLEISAMEICDTFKGKDAAEATRRGQRAKEAQELLGRLTDACDEAWPLPWYLREWLEDIDATREGTYEVSPDELEALVADADEFERLWEASARLTARHLLVALGEIDFLLSSTSGGSGGPGGPRGRAVAERCQKAIEDIPRLLRGQ